VSLTVGRYTFGAWLRKGISGAIEQVDTLGTSGGPVKERASVPVDVDVNTLPVHKDFALLGPGDVIGINPRVVVRTEPRDWVTDFEPNYLAFVEFYDEDFIWRYTPARAAGDRLRPWLALLVLQEDEPGKPGEFTRNDRRLPLPSVTVTAASALPAPGEAWAWGHVHVNDSFDQATDFEKFLESLHDVDDPNADRIICRLASPRHLAPNTPYGAFVVPAFETGRLAGLGQDPSAVDAQQASWGTAAGVELPVYYEWRFRTGENEDFEELAKRLKPWPADPRVGERPMDGEQPSWGLTEGTDIGQILPADEKQTVLGLEGALRAPTTESRPPVVDPSKPFFGQLEEVLNFPEQLRTNPATADLPVVSPPIYGEHHALRHTIDAANDDWLDSLNRDPRTRVAAGFGVEVVQENQEDYVARAWAQVRKVLDANRRILLFSYAMFASRATYANLASRFSPEQRLVFFGPVLQKVRGSATTLRHQVTLSTLPPAALSAPMRRLVRPRGPVGRTVVGIDSTFTHAGLVGALAADRASPAPPKPVPSDLTTVAATAAQLPADGGGTPSWLQLALRFRWLVLALLLLVLLVVAVATGAWLVAIVLAVAAVVAAVGVGAIPRGPGGGGAGGEGATLRDPSRIAAAVREAPQRPGFRFVEVDPVDPPEPAAGTTVQTGPAATSSGADAVRFTQVTSETAAAAGADTAEAADFRAAATALNERLAITVDAQRFATFDVAAADAKLVAAIDPLVAFPRVVAATVLFPFDPSWLLEPEHLVPAMAYPDFDDPMYEKLRDISTELLVPNLELIPPNSITLLETNPPFIESYLVGLNYEFGKELLWREYPTDRRGSYFRQFWDVKGIIAEPPHESPADVSERAKDIVPLDTWPSQSKLGDHRNPLRPAGKQLVLTIRGDLLKKYPNTLVYAQKAHLAHGPHGEPEPDSDPVIATVATEADVEREIKFPAFKAAVEPDIRFFGFDLTAAAARGADHPRLDTDDWGWYFVIQQLPGEPRFGMDVEYSPDGTTPTWDDLAWDLFPTGQLFVDTSVAPSFTPAGAGESIAQWGTDAARMASILFQKPVMIAVHAKEMLEGLA
jgi:hypothetical protein